VLSGFVHRLGTLFDLTQIILGAFAGPLLVVVVMSVTRRAVAPKGIIVGLVSGCVAGWLAACSPIAPLWTAPIAAACTLLVAHVYPRSGG
jgi:Na+/proline symporter